MNIELSVTASENYYVGRSVFNITAEEEGTGREEGVGSIHIGADKVIINRQNKSYLIPFKDLWNAIAIATGHPDEISE